MLFFKFNKTIFNTIMDRKKFLTRVCTLGGCLCGFSALANSNPIPGNSNLSTDDDSHTLMQEWIASLLSNLDAGVHKQDLRKIIKKSAIVHYNNLKMDNLLKDYENKPKDFVTFIEEKWGWKVDYNPATKTITANENKNYCVCPMVNKEKGISSAICYCSEGFAEKMFSKVIGQPVNATVISSIHRGDKSCIYQIKW
jgi:hypothetical protein